MSDLQTAPKMCVMCMIEYTSSPEWLSLRLLGALRRSHLTTLHPQGNDCFIIWAVGHGSFLKNKLEFNIDVHKQCIEYGFFSLSLPLATVSGVSYLNFKEIRFFTS